MFRFTVFVAILVTSAYAEIATPCVGGGELPISFEIEGCSSAPCSLPQLEDAVFRAQFKARSKSQSLRAGLSVFFFNIISIPFDLGAASDACSGLSSDCPISKDQVLDYSLRLPIEPFFPAGTFTFIEVSVSDDSGAPAFCARVLVTITAPRR